MKADFSGYATKAGIKCSDGKTILAHAFRHQDKTRVPLVWHHGHNVPENVLGHALLENREDGVYAYGFFNNTKAAQHIKEAVVHGDINMMSIWANKLKMQASQVVHGVIREVSLVLSGANPGALIENISISHADDDDTVLDDEAIIYTGLLIHSEDGVSDDETSNDETSADEKEDNTSDDEDEAKEDLNHADGDDDETLEDIYNSMTDKQKDVLHFMLGEALEAAGADAAKHDNLDSEGNNEMTNVFENRKASAPVISHDDMKSIMATAMKEGSLKDAVEAYALDHLSHGVEDIDILFPDAKAVSDVPEFLRRRTEWVGALLAGTKKSPFARIKTVSADLTHEEARAKGYVKGSLKKEEFFGVAKRTTNPTTIYKKQKLDRDDVIDITDFDVIVWLKAEMRIMLDEEIARAILLGDGRDPGSEDKISETSIRPIAKDHELFNTTVYVNIGDASSSITEVTDAIIRNRKWLKGTGMPTLYTTETYISMWLLLKDGTGRRIYSSLDELANELRVAKIVPVEVMEEEEDIVCILVNPIDYTVGADKGGAVSFFDDFDIDYNQMKYLIETRISGALTKLKSALTVRKTESTDVLVVPTAPTFEDNEVTITNTTGVVYKNGAGTTINNAGSPYAVAEGSTYVVNATPAAGYFFENDAEDSWSFTHPEA